MVCTSYGTQNHEDARFFYKCGVAIAAGFQQTAVKNETPIPQTSAVVKPALWSPNAVANWSLVFTPVLGSTLNYLNWKALGEAERGEHATR